MKFQFQFTESNLVSIRAWEIETHKSVVSIRCMEIETEPNHESYFSIYQIMKFQFTEPLIYRITEFQFTESLSFNLPTEFQFTDFTESLSFNLPNH